MQDINIGDVVRIKPSGNSSRDVMFSGFRARVMELGHNNEAYLQSHLNDAVMFKVWWNKTLLEVIHDEDKRRR
jgi:hypothetical protein